MSGAYSRNKGARWERTFVKYLRAAGYDAKRNLEETREGNSGDIDVDAPLTFQVKAGKRPRWRTAVKEAAEVARTRSDYAVAAIHVDHEGDYAILPWDDFAEILQLIRGNRIW